MPVPSTNFSRRDFLRSSSACAMLAPIFERNLEEWIPAEWHSLEKRPDDETDWRMVKRQFFIEDGLMYMNTGTFGPTLRAAHDAVCKNLFELGANYNKSFRTNLMGDAVPKFIGRVAEFIGAKPDEVAFTSGTTEAMNYIANGLELKAGDEIVTTKHEHLGGIYPWLLKAKRSGISVKQIDLKTPPASETELLEQFERGLTPNTRVLSFCHVQYTDGAILPVKKICEMARRRGILTVVDGAQAIGMLNFRIDDLGCDFYTASFHKWLSSPYGCGLLYVREEMRDRLWPTVVLSYSGWNEVDRNGNPGITDISYAPKYPKALLKYSSNIEYYGSLYWTVAIAMDFQNLIGRDRIEARIRSLGLRIVKALSDLPGVRIHSPENLALQSGLISFRLEKWKTDELFFALRKDRNIVGRFIKHPGMNFDVNRLSTNIFNLTEDVDAAIAALREKA